MNCLNRKLYNVFGCKGLESYLGKMDKYCIKTVQEFSEFIAFDRPAIASVYSAEQFKIHNIDCPASFEEILKGTRGFLLYQEDILKIADYFKIENPMKLLQSFFNKQSKINDYKKNNE